MKVSYQDLIFNKRINKLKSKMNEFEPKELSPLSLNHNVKLKMYDMLKDDSQIEEINQVVKKQRE